MPPPVVRLRVEHRGDVAIAGFVDRKLYFQEEIDQIADEMTAMIAAGPVKKLVLDLTGVEYLASAAFGMLVKVKKRIGALGGTMRLANCSADLLEVFKLTRLDLVFPIDPDVPAALAAS